MALAREGEARKHEDVRRGRKPRSHEAAEDQPTISRHHQRARTTPAGPAPMTRPVRLPLSARHNPTINSKPAATFDGHGLAAFAHPTQLCNSPEPARWRSIPACAGEPDAPPVDSTGGEVDPRVCGGAEMLAIMCGIWMGRSPRVRGSPTASASPAAWCGSIPACAGEPMIMNTCITHCGVDPRVRGGAGHLYWSVLICAGRSPRTRGSPLCLAVNRILLRSIPAYAGEPVLRFAVWRHPVVDPRVRGGAEAWCVDATDEMGRSPRTRGSLAGARQSHAGDGSIPAYAGEPPTMDDGFALFRVDPRVRGGAFVTKIVLRVLPGRSPRTRGSHGRLYGPHGLERSIPAYAGEPHPDHEDEASNQVDPRVRGGAAFFLASFSRSAGRSPRTRGSQDRGHDVAVVARSIPAYAGEPT